jgi:hypothetical protein
MSLVLYPGSPTADGGALVVYTGTPSRSVSWSLSGNGTLTPITNYTDHNGVAAARYDADAGSPGAVAGATITITVTAGA